MIRLAALFGAAGQPEQGWVVCWLHYKEGGRSEGADKALEKSKGLSKALGLLRVPRARVESLKALL